MIQTMANLLEALEKSGPIFEYVFFWGGPLSNWYPAKFTADYRDYLTSEHYFMAHKAMIFHDMETLQKIFKAQTPSEAKSLGRKVVGFNNKIWDDYKEHIMIDANVHKFSQNEEEKNYLLSTGNKILVEASPYDKIWGIGMGEDHPTIHDPTTWKGLNLLGFCLMEVRRRLQEQQLNIKQD